MAKRKLTEKFSEKRKTKTYFGSLQMLRKQLVADINLTKV